MITLLVLLACGEDLGYAPCEVAEDCADATPEGAEAACLDKADNGLLHLDL